MMSILWTVFWFIIVISALVFVHELGHFIMAKCSGIKVLEFALGFGPKLIKVQRGETLYSIRLLPLGGFCRFLGEHTDLTPELEEGKITPEEYERLLPRTFEHKNYARRMAVLMGGSIFNLLFGAILFILLFAVWGVTVPQSNILAEVIPDSPASQGGLLPGDRIVSVNGLPTPDWQTLISAIAAAAVPQKDSQAEPQDGLPTKHPDLQTEPQIDPQTSLPPDQPAYLPLNLTVQTSDGNLKDVTITPKEDEATKKPLIGIRSATAYQKLSPIEALTHGMGVTADFTKAIVSSLFGLVTTGQDADQMVGPVGIAQLVGQSATHGIYQLGILMAFLSINFCVVNLLPLPALDGGQLVTLTYEKIRGKELKPETKGFIQLVGFALIMTLMVVLIFKDILFPVVTP